MGKKMSSEERAKRALDRDRRALEEFARGMVPSVLGKAVIALRDASIPITNQAVIEHLRAEQTRAYKSDRAPDLQTFFDQPYQFAIDQLLEPTSSPQEPNSSAFKIEGAAS